MKSYSVTIKPIDSRCRHWVKIVRTGQALPPPVDVQGANDIPVPYANLGDEELMPGTCCSKARRIIIDGPTAAGLTGFELSQTMAIFYRCVPGSALKRPR